MRVNHATIHAHSWEDSFFCKQNEYDGRFLQ